MAETTSIWEDKKGDPRKIYKALKNSTPGDFNRDDINTAFYFAFPGEEQDDTNETHTQFLVQAARCLKDLETFEKSEEDAKLEEFREKMRNYLKAQGLDPSTIPIETIDALIVQAAEYVNNPEIDEDTSITLVYTDGDEQMMVTEDGEILGLIDAPAHDEDRRKILEWVGERLTTAQGRQAALEAEKAVWMKKIEDRYNADINKQIRVQAYLSNVYASTGQGYLDDIRKQAEIKDQKIPASVKLGMLTLKYTKSRGSTAVEDADAAIAYCETAFPEAIKKSVLVSMIPDEAKPKLPEGCGLKYTAGGVLSFGMK